MRRRHYGIELTKSQAERHFDKWFGKPLRPTFMSCGAGLFMSAQIVSQFKMLISLDISGN
jgi:hypothetical protein